MCVFLFSQSTDVEGMFEMHQALLLTEQLRATDPLASAKQMRGGQVK